MNTSIKVLLFTSKTLSNGEHPIMLRVIKDRKPKYISVGLSSSLDMWDTKENLPKKKHPLYKQAKIKIAQKKLDAEKLILDLENENKNFSSYEIKGKLKKEKVNNPHVYPYFDVVIKRLKESGQIKNAEVYKDTKRNLSYFTTSINELHFSDIDVQFLNKFEEYLKVKGKGGNTIYIYLRTLRALINKAIKEEVTSEKYYAFKRFSLAKYTKIKTAKRAITKDEIEKIKTVNLEKHPELVDAKNLFLFSYYCRGMNFIDMSLLQWKNVSNDRISYTRQKTKELFNMQLLQPAIEILNSYRPITFSTPNSYIFPIFNENHNTPQSLHNRRVKMNREINSQLKDLAGKAKISSELTTYVARHTYATVMKRSGQSTALISEALGHDSEKTTQIYLDSFENSILDEASKSIL